jgi:hypothetical protein
MYDDGKANLSVNRNGIITGKTSWDLVAWGASDGAVQDSMLAAYGADDVEKEMNALAYRDRWNMRVPVQMARSQHYYWLNELGAHTRTEEMDGIVIFDDQVSLPYDTSAVDAFGALLVREPPKLPALDNDEVKPPENI